MHRTGSNRPWMLGLLSSTVPSVGRCRLPGGRRHHRDAYAELPVFAIAVAAFGDRCAERHSRSCGQGWVGYRWPRAPRSGAGGDLDHTEGDTPTTSRANPAEQGRGPTGVAPSGPAG